ncbi:RNA-binding protein 34-like isoform X2 [Portunus trituberculatus]|uniref:RNA-binding protein 34-like isoform X2 n=1 Tax=Portunus trituberculatus TaxID=210409 RepID=UPI001E1CB31F|nr:RNA-binding protein 34-like isoform X2 [Portunus trituberculatus]XP_045126301.1 RNA-binding protein 34-like isoform X2 [Portunus trituberculatus]
MKTKKASKCPGQSSIDSSGIVKKTNKKKMKFLAQNMSSCNEVIEAMEAGSAVAMSSLYPKSNKQKKSKMKNSEKLADSATSDLSNVMELQMKNGNVDVKNYPDITHMPADTSLSEVLPKTKKVLKNNQANLQALTENSSGANKKNKKHKKAKMNVFGMPESNDEKEQRTIFVGNVNTKTTRKSLTRFFNKYGKVDAVRLRCAAVPTPGTTKRQAVIMNNFHEKRTSLSAYVRFTERAMVEAALKANGAELDEKHLHIDRSQGSNRNTKLAVFIGNLAFEAEEEALRSHFASCGEMESVRIVRDKKMSSGKGFGYVNFMSEDAVEMALQMDGKIFMHRQLRVQRCAKQGKKGQKPMFKTRGKKGLSFMKNKPTSTKTSKKQLNFTGKKMMETKKFKKMKAKAKFTREDRKKKAIAHKLAGVK